VRQCSLGLEQKPAAFDGVLDGGGRGGEGSAMLALDLRNKGVHERSWHPGIWRPGVRVIISAACLYLPPLLHAIAEWHTIGTPPGGNSATAACAPSDARPCRFGALPRQTLRAMARRQP
jgi:hypothetical protein